MQFLQNEHALTVISHRAISISLIALSLIVIRRVYRISLPFKAANAHIRQEDHIIT